MLFALVVVLLAYAAWWLGGWQFRRLPDRKAENARPHQRARAAGTRRGRAHPGTPRHDQGRVARSSATGTYDAGHTVVVRYRTRDGACGIDVVVPLVTADGTALLVDRGWLAADTRARPAATYPPHRPARSRSTGWVRADATGDSTESRPLHPGDLQRARSATAIDQAGLRRLRGARHPRTASRPPTSCRSSCPSSTTGRTSSTACSGGSSASWRSSASATWPGTSGARRAAASRPRAESALSERKTKRAAKNAHKQAVQAAYQKAYAEERAAREAHRARSMPPSTGSITPETKDAAGDSTKAATRPNSSGSP